MPSSVSLSLATLLSFSSVLGKTRTLRPAGNPPDELIMDSLNISITTTTSKLKEAKTKHVIDKGSGSLITRCLDIKNRNRNCEICNLELGYLM